MPEPPYRALCILLRVFSLLAAVGGLVLIFAEKPLIMRIFLRPPEAEVSTLLRSLLKEMGGMALMLGVLLWLASRNPVRNVAIVDGNSRSALSAATAGGTLGTCREFLKSEL